MQYAQPMVHNGSMLGLWIVRDAAAQPLLAKVEDELYVLAFTSAPKAIKARTAFSAEGLPFLIVGPNLRNVVDGARAAGAIGFIVDYDTEQALFASAHPLPVDMPLAAAR
jgi:hypothetical protein